MTQQNSVPVTIPCPAQFWPQQSPIDLVDAIRARFPSDYLQLDYPSRVTGAFRKDPPPDDHGFNLVLTPESNATITLGGDTCVLKKIHFHARSEHRRGERDYPLEIHLVHEIKQPTLGSTNVVLGIFIDDKEAKGTTKSFIAINEFLGSPALKNKIARISNRELSPFDDSPEGEVIEFNPKHCLPKNLKKFYRYEGSLTTAPFTEAVNWLVFHAPLRAVTSDIEEIRKCADHTARPIQPINRRFVLRSF